MNWRELPGAPPAGTEVCRLAEVPSDNGLERRFGAAEPRFALVVLRHANGVVGYLNRCPHAGIPMNFSDDVFCLIESDGQRDLLCPHHSALFRLPQGECHDGPCRGDRLTAVPLEVSEGVVRIAISPQPHLFQEIE
ncbi:MAG: Rieske 2Fe-2S domain-containing protein [Burkholderiaceae bacterium]|nr:Rieske 2Fe-2S domain-containing protein [Burkholderiaceae bacterium]